MTGAGPARTGVIALKTFRAVVLIFALGACFVTCGEPFESSPFDDAGGSAGSSASGNGGNGGNGGSAGGEGNSAGTGGNTTGTTGGSDGGSPNPAAGGEGGLGGAGEGPAPPVAKEGLVLWLRATHGVGHENGVVSSWEDQSGNANHATQTADNVMPKLDEGALAGQPALVFDEDDFLRLPAGFSDFSQGLTVFAVGQFDQEACVAFFHLGNGPEVDDIELGRSPTGVFYEVSDNWNDSAQWELGQPLLATVVHRPTEAVEMRFNQMLSAEPQMPLPAVVERLQNVVGRSDYADCSALQGKLSELLIYTRAVSDDELLAIEGYLQQEWSCCE